MPVTPRSKKPTLLKPRRCKYCRGSFVPERAQDKDAKFCCPNHRKAFWRYGGLPFDKMKEQLMKDVRKMVRAEIAELAEQVRKLVEPMLDDAVSDIVGRELAHVDLLEVCLAGELHTHAITYHGSTLK